MPITIEQHEKRSEEPVLCEQLSVRDYLDNIMVRTSGAFVAGYELRGITSYFASDEERNRGKVMLGALLKAIPEQSVTLQVRYEVVEDLGSILGAYEAQNRSGAQVVNLLDAHSMAAWQRKAEEGLYLRPLLAAYFIWDSRVHHRVTGNPQPQKRNFSLSTKTAIRRSRREHEELIGEFESLLVGIEATMQAAGLGPRRMSDDELFRETKRALNPLDCDSRPYVPAVDWIRYRSAREQLTNASIVYENDSYLIVGGLLYTFVSLKEPPDATFPGILRELLSLDFPIITNTQLTIPDQTKVLKNYRSRLRKMQAAQRDTHGGFRINVEAQAFKRGCACFGLGRYLYYFRGVWVDLDDRKQPRSRPGLPEWATPAGWLKGLRPETYSASNSSHETDGTERSNSQPAQNGRSANVEIAPIVREIEGMQERLGNRVYRGLLKKLARVWSPTEIQDRAMLERLLNHMEAAERGFRRVEELVTELGRGPLIAVLNSLNVTSLEQVADLDTLKRIVVALEAKTRPVAR